MKYISIDTETGGLGPETSLLSLGIVIADENFNILHEEEYLFKPKDGKYTIEPTALSVNKIDLVELDKNGINLSAGGRALYELLNNFSCRGKDKLVPVGKNTYFDIMRVWNNLMSRGTWETFCSYRIIDISSVCQFLKDALVIPTDVTGSLDSLRKYYSVDAGVSHTALDDAIDTLFVYREMLTDALIGGGSEMDKKAAQIEKGIKRG